MRKLLFGLVALPFLASIASAGQPLSDQQMDRVIAGFGTAPDACDCVSPQPAPIPPPTPLQTTGLEISELSAIAGSFQNVFTFSFGF